ncbi:MAG: hypothetical protein GXO39_05260 [Thermotogae bacterium]|nr:hypothetical protein [Thermotogota bacterium]
MDTERIILIKLAENIQKSLREFIRIHGLPSPEFCVYNDGSSVILKSRRSRKFKRRMTCILQPEFFTVIVDDMVVMYDRLHSHDGISPEQRIVNFLFDVLLEYIVSD